MSELKKAAAKKSTETLVLAISLIGGGIVSVEKRMVRAAILDVLWDREGEDFVDGVTESLGM